MATAAASVRRPPAPQAAAPPPEKPKEPAPNAKSGRRVVVGCKVPGGLLLRLFEPHDAQEPVLGGGTRTYKRHVQKGPMVRVNGPAIPFGILPRYPIIANAALTTIDADFWDEWLKQNQDADVVKNRLIFANEKRDDTRAEAKDLKSVRSGLEPIVPDTDPRIPRPASSQLTKIASEEESVKRRAEAIAKNADRDEQAEETDFED